MPGVGAGTVITGLITVGAAVAADRRADEAAEAREKAQEKRQEVQKQQNFRRKVQELRRARAARARTIAGSEAAGAERSSGARAAAGSIRGQAASNISFLNDLNATGQRITDLQGQAAGAEQEARLFQTIGGNAGQIGTIFEGATSVFDDGTQTPRPSGGQ
jgi:hypothetical protein